MQIEYRVGDMFVGPEPMLIHGCNAQGVMGSGVALKVRTDYPAAYDAYVTAFRKHGLALGEVIWADCPDPTTGRRMIGNAITQQNFGRNPNVVYVDYERGIRRALQEVEVTARAMGITAVALPLIGAGLANGKWATIAAIIEQEAKSFTPVVYVLPGQSVPT